MDEDQLVRPQDLAEISDHREATAPELNRPSNKWLDRSIRDYLVAIRRWLLRGVSTLPLAAVLLLAAIPPLLVARDRWLGDRPLQDAFRPTWCSVDYLCHLALPSYF